jgi:hypothetical protein
MTMANIFNDQEPVRAGRLTPAYWAALGAMAAPYGAHAGLKAAQEEDVRLAAYRAKHPDIVSVWEKFRTIDAVGGYFIQKYRDGAAERGHAAVAAQLKKQGVPLDMALRILGFRSRA